jgi:hypothetical protein
LVLDGFTNFVIRKRLPDDVLAARRVRVRAAPRRGAGRCHSRVSAQAYGAEAL